METAYERPPQRAPGKVCFEVGRLDATAGAVKALIANQIDPYTLLRRHERGDYGMLSAGQRAENATALAADGRILSVHKIGGDALWIITEPGRGTTNLVLQSEILEYQDEERECE
jgi:hypothetical protein